MPSMAEVFGIVVGGAALAENIFTVGLKIRTLYNDMQEASAEITTTLDYIQILAQMLEELGKSPMTSHIVLQTALSHCEKCLQELQATLRILESNRQTTRGFLSKFLRLNIITHKDAVVKMERRLEASLRLLLFAVQLVTLASQERIG